MEVNNIQIQKQKIEELIKQIENKKAIRVGKELVLEWRYISMSRIEELKEFIVVYGEIEEKRRLTYEDWNVEEGYSIIYPKTNLVILLYFRIYENEEKKEESYTYYVYYKGDWYKI